MRRFGLRFLCVLTLGLLLGPNTLAAEAGRSTEAKLALVVGNSSYKKSPLRNPVNDARLIAETLEASGFQVVRTENASLREMRRAVRDFGDRLKESGGVGLFYFAGHGIQVRGENYLVSIDSDIQREEEIAEDSISAQLVLDKMLAAGNRMNIIILDACRDNPFSGRSRTSSTGLASMNAGVGSLIAYATAPGMVAADGAGKNGLYTRHLASAMSTPGLPIEEVFKRVRVAVRTESNKQQIPWESTSLEGEFSFRPASPKQALEAPKPPASVANNSGAGGAGMELALWEEVKSSGAPSDLQLYLDKYPNGTFAAVAKRRLSTLPAQPTAPAPRPEVVAVAKPTVVAPPPSSAQALLRRDRGELVISGRFNVRSTLQVQPVVGAPETTRYTSGDVLGNNGQMLAVRIGTHVGVLRSGQLWSFPLVDGAYGKAELIFDGEGSPGAIKWRVVAAADGKYQLLVDVELPFSGSGMSGGQGRLRGTWNAVFDNTYPFPAQTKLVVRLNASGWANANESTETIWKPSP